MSKSPSEKKNFQISIDAILALDAISRRKSYAQASEELHKVPSAISYTIQKCEQDLKVKLIDRSGHKAELTEAGKAFLEYGKQVLDSISELVQKTQQADLGWEREARIAIDTIFPVEIIYPLIKNFYKSCPAGVKVQILEEVFGGIADALYTGRADIVIGASSSLIESSSRFRSQIFGEANFVFAVSPSHSICKRKQPLSGEDIENEIAVVVTDTSLTMAAKTSGILEGQLTFRVPSMKDKIAAQIQSLGVGYLPLHLIGDALNNKELVILKTETGREKAQLCIAWDGRNKGKALEWFVNEIQQSKIFEKFLRGGNKSTK
jgi:DNA-binding transcriptional LysR family regulator